MKYTIGCHVLNAKGEEAEGVYVFGEYGLPYIAADVEKFVNKKQHIYVIDGAENTQKYIQYLSRLYRYEFKGRAKKLDVPVREFRFYPIKLTDKRFNDCTFEKDNTWKHNNKASAKYHFLGDIYSTTLC